MGDGGSVFGSGPGAWLVFGVGFAMMGIGHVIGFFRGTRTNRSNTK